jgi:hypothetical protein
MWQVSIVHRCGHAQPTVKPNYMNPNTKILPHEARDIFERQQASPSCYPELNNGDGL